MKAEELRIGNWLHVNHSDNFVKVESINKDGINLWGNTDYWDELFCTHETNDLVGIPLTPEILEKCGFVNEFDSSFINNEIEIWGVNGNFHYSVNDDKIIAVQYLHQLQNLYFALTGEELQIDLHANKSVNK